MKSLIIFMFIIAFAMAKPGLDPDNPSHRGFSDKLDNKFSDSTVYNNFARPVIHGTYHTGRFLNSGNTEEWARAKDQFSKVGTGQQQTEYLEIYRNQNKSNK